MFMYRRDPGTSKDGSTFPSERRIDWPSIPQNSKAWLGRLGGEITSGICSQCYKTVSETNRTSVNWR